MPITPEALYLQLGRLVQSIPNLLEPLPLPRSTLEWLGQVDALIDHSGDVMDQVDFQTARGGLPFPTLQLSSAQSLQMVIFRALAKAEARAPQGVRGSFIPPVMFLMRSPLSPKSSARRRKTY